MENTAAIICSSCIHTAESKKVKFKQHHLTSSIQSFCNYHIIQQDLIKNQIWEFKIFCKNFFFSKLQREMINIFWPKKGKDMAQFQVDLIERVK